MINKKNKKTNLNSLLENKIKRIINEEDLKLKIKKTKEDIIGYHTLPPQIDNTKPYLAKAEQAIKFLKSITKKNIN